MEKTIAVAQPLAGTASTLPPETESMARFGRPAMGALLFLAVLYASLLPFRFDATRLNPAYLQEYLLRVHAVPLEDLVVNAAVYAVLGAGLFLCRKRRTSVAAAIVIATCAGLSLAVELLQSLIPQRVSSCTDLLLNTAGALFGVMLATRTSSVSLKVKGLIVREYRTRPLAFLVIALSSGLLAYELAPFDFITCTDQLHDCFRRIQLISDFHLGLAAVLEELPSAAWFALLGLLVTRDILGRNAQDAGCSLHAFCAGLGHGLLLACLIECLQLFTRSHVPEAAAVILRTLAAAMGAWTAAFIINQDPKPRIPHTVPIFSTSMLLAAAGFQLLVLVLTLRTAAARPSASMDQISSLPFQALWLQPVPLAGAKALSALVTAGLLAGTLAAALRRAGLPLFRVITSLLVVGCYIAVPLMSATGTMQTFDATNSLLAVLACGFALRIERGLARLDQLEHRASEV